MTCKGPFAFMHFPDVSFILYCCSKTFSKLGAFSQWLFFPLWIFWISFYIIMELLSNVFMFSSYVGFQITTSSKLQITKMTCKGPFSFMNFPYVSFHFTAVEKLFSTLVAFCRWFFFPFVDYLDMFVQTSSLIKLLSTKLTTEFLSFMNYKNMVL